MFSIEMDFHMKSVIEFESIDTSTPHFDGNQEWIQVQNIRNTNKHIYDSIEISISGVCFITQTFAIHKYFMFHRAREEKRDAQIIHNIPIILRFLSLTRMRNIQCDRLPMGKIDSMLPWLYKACFLTHKIVRIHHIVLETSIPP